jgi:hypothetical protein
VVHAQPKWQISTMRLFSPSLIACALAGVLSAACAAQKLDKASSQYSQVYTLAVPELRCPEKKVDVRSVGESRVVASGCDRATSFVYACRKPGPKELEYLKRSPEPPSEESIQAEAVSGTPQAEAKVVQLRAQQIKYDQELVAQRIADLEGGAVEGFAPRHQLPEMPKRWLNQECRYMHEADE